MIIILTIWNRLLLSITSLKSTESFKCAVKTLLFGDAFALQFNLTFFKYFLDSFIFVRSYSHILASIFYITVSFSVGILYYIVLTRLTYFIETRNISIKLLL